MRNRRPNGTEWVWNQLEVHGDMESFRDFLDTAAGPGLIEWHLEGYSLYESIYYITRTQTSSHQQADRLAKTFRSNIERLASNQIREAETDPSRVPFDLNKIIPVPVDHLIKGVTEATRWMMKNWGTPAPLRRVTFDMKSRTVADTFIPNIAVFRFLSADWSPWQAMLHCRQRWPGLTFDLTYEFPEPIADRSTPDDKPRKHQEKKQADPTPPPQRRSRHARSN